MLYDFANLYIRVNEFVRNHLFGAIIIVATVTYFGWDTVKAFPYNYVKNIISKETSEPLSNIEILILKQEYKQLNEDIMYIKDKKNGGTATASDINKLNRIEIRKETLDRDIALKKSVIKKV